MPPSISDAQLCDHTTFRLGGPCKGLLTAETLEQCEEAVKYFNENKSPFIVIGSGSNLVVSDQGLDCYVLRYVSESPIFDFDQDEVTVSGSTHLDVFVNVMAQIGSAGINYASGIPGTVGGAVVGNAGAFGKQIADVLTKATLLSPTGEKRIVTQADLKFTYRHSVLKETKDIVLDVTLKMTAGDRDTLLAERAEILKVRSEKHPDLSKEPCAGSFFRNIEPTSSAGRRQATGWFLDQAGGKNLKSGGAYIFAKHANIIVKGDDATAEDVFDLSEQMKALAKEKHDLDLVREVRFAGDFKNKPADVDDIIW